MSSKKQTSVEWLAQELDKYNKEPWKYFGKDGNQSKAKERIIDKAKEIHKEEIVDAWVNGINSLDEINEDELSEQYYKETYEQ